MKRNASWYWHRLRAMSAQEVVEHMRLASEKRQWRRHGSWGTQLPKHGLTDKWLTSDLESVDQTEREAVLAEAGCYLRGEYRLLNLSFQESPMDWQLDPQTGTRPVAGFGPDMDFLDTTLVGNIKYLWEKNRHHHLTVLALAYALSKEERYAQEVRLQLESWTEQNPFPIGINWASSLEAGVRLVSWTWIERLLRGSSIHEPLFGAQGALWPAIYRHQWIVEQRHSHGSSANNHLIGEMAGLFIAATVWPVFDESERWRDLARRTLETEIVRQTFPSGINRELAFDYHIFTQELFLLVFLEAERIGAPFSSEYRSRLTRMIEVVPQLTDFGNNLPRYGDGDGGMAVQLKALSVNTSLLTEGSLAATLLGAKPLLPTNPASNRGCAALEDAGLYVLASQRNTAQEVFVLADAGPHGYLSTAAHAHADALSFTLSAGGKPLFVDPGTYDYLVDERWRRYFRSTRAHNTVEVDGLDQSTQAGPFLWTQKAKTTVHRWETTDSGATLVASHDGYRRVGAIHQRSLELRGKTLTILDELRGTGEHDATLCFHLAPECEVERVSSSAINIVREGKQARLALPEALEISLVRGGEDAGWYSPHYGVKVPTWSVLARVRGSLPRSWKTVIEVTP